MTLRRSWIAVAACVFWAAAAGADEDAYSRSGWTVGLGAGVALSAFEANSSTGAAAEFGIQGGYRLTPHVAVEGQVYHVHQLAYDLAPYGSASFWTILGDVRGYLPLGRLQPFVLAGIGPRVQILKEASDSSVSNTQVDGTVVLGGGVDYYLTERILLSLDGKYNWGFDRSPALDYGTISLSGVYRFR
jgi:hypothetical protein